MAIQDESTTMVMPVQPMGGNCYNNGGCGGLFGGGDSWLGILFLIALLGGGWGGFGGFGGGYGAMMGMGMMDGFGLYPWLNNSQNINDGFRSQALGTQVGGIQNSITAGFGDIQTALCGGFAGVNQNISNGTATIQNSLCNGFNGITQSINNAQITNLERSFAAQTANTAGMTALQSQLAQCCCDNRLATAQTQALVQSENCADRYEAAKNTQGIISAITAGIQSIKDDLCQDRLDAERRENANLRSELMFARGQASQNDQTAQLRAFAATTANQAIAELRSCPIPSQPVYGNQPIFTCNSNNAGCGCAVA